MYDVTSFLANHPGGSAIILAVAGRDATNAFEDVGMFKQILKIIIEINKTNIFNISLGHSFFARKKLQVEKKD